MTGGGAPFFRRSSSSTRAAGRGGRQSSSAERYQMSTSEDYSGLSTTEEQDEDEDAPGGRRTTRSSSRNIRGVNHNGGERWKHVSASPPPILEEQESEFSKKNRNNSSSSRTRPSRPSTAGRYRNIEIFKTRGRRGRRTSQTSPPGTKGKPVVHQEHSSGLPLPANENDVDCPISPPKVDLNAMMAQLGVLSPESSPDGGRVRRRDEQALEEHSKQLRKLLGSSGGGTAAKEQRPDDSLPETSDEGDLQDDDGVVGIKYLQDEDAFDVDRHLLDLEQDLGLGEDGSAGEEVPDLSGLLYATTDAGCSSHDEQLSSALLADRGGGGSHVAHQRPQALPSRTSANPKPLSSRTTPPAPSSSTSMIGFQRSTSKMSSSSIASAGSPGFPPGPESSSASAQQHQPQPVNNCQEDDHTSTHQSVRAPPRPKRNVSASLRRNRDKIFMMEGDHCALPPPPPRGSAQVSSTSKVSAVESSRASTAPAADEEHTRTRSRRKTKKHLSFFSRDFRSRFVPFIDACVSNRALRALHRRTPRMRLGNYLLFQVHRAYLNDETLMSLSLAQLPMSLAEAHQLEPRILPKLLQSLQSNSHLENLDLRGLKGDSSSSTEGSSNNNSPSEQDDPHPLSTFFAASFFSALGSALEANSTLKYLDMSGNFVMDVSTSEDQGSKAILPLLSSLFTFADSLAHNSGLEVLNIGEIEDVTIDVDLRKTVEDELLNMQENKDNKFNYNNIRRMKNMMNNKILFEDQREIDQFLRLLVEEEDQISAAVPDLAVSLWERRLAFALKSNSTLLKLGMVFHDRLAKEAVDATLARNQKLRFQTRRMRLLRFQERRLLRELMVEDLEEE
ncbi:unnamed protein product [Amoebophrya sp. A25]|nr:unnamed protein product [Amoebophrya sp. A25]|eukprot:GSA25T00003450001.1